MNEAQLRNTLIINVGSLSYQSYPPMFLGDVSVANGPTPGAVTAAIGEGTDVDLSQLTTPGYYRIMNLDSTNFVTYGIYDHIHGHFHPWGEILPGETYTGRLSRYFGEEHGTGTGSGTGPGDWDTNTSDTFRLIADTAPVIVLVEAFES